MISPVSWCCYFCKCDLKLCSGWFVIQTNIYFNKIGRSSITIITLNFEHAFALVKWDFWFFLLFQFFEIVWKQNNLQKIKNRIDIFQANFVPDLFSAKLNGKRQKCFRKFVFIVFFAKLNRYWVRIKGLKVLCYFIISGYLFLPQLLVDRLVRKKQNFYLLMCLFLKTIMNSIQKEFWELFHIDRQQIVKNNLIKYLIHKFFSVFQCIHTSTFRVWKRQFSSSAPSFVSHWIVSWISGKKILSCVVNYFQQQKWNNQCDSLTELSCFLIFHVFWKT